MYRPMPSTFPAPGELRGPNHNNSNFQFADAVAYTAFYANIRSFDFGAFAAVVGQQDGRLMTAEAMKSALRTDAQWNEPRPPLENDGAPRDCGLCGREFQPKIHTFTYPDGNPGKNGDFTTFKADQLKELVETAREGGRPEVAERIEKSAAAMTALAMCGEPVPGKAQALPIDSKCRHDLEEIKRAALRERFGREPEPRQYRLRSFVFDELADALKGADQRIGYHEDRNFVLEALGGGSRPTHRAVGSGPGRFDRREDNRPRRNWRGAELLTETADALDAAGYTNLSDAHAAAKSGKLLEQGIVPTPKALSAVEAILFRAGNGRQIVGTARGTSSVATDRPVKAVARRKQLEEDGGGASRPTSRGNRTVRVPTSAVGLANLRG